MSKVRLPKIPRGNLGKVYMLSDIAANVFFNESSEIVREHWPWPNEYVVPSIEKVVITLKGTPQLYLPTIMDHLTDGHFDLQVDYKRGFKDKGKSERKRDCGSELFRFLCVVERHEDKRKSGDTRVIRPDSHIFIYGVYRPERIEFPNEVLEEDLASVEIMEDLNRQINPALKNISDGIANAMEKRGAVLTRGMLDNQFVI